MPNHRVAAAVAAGGSVLAAAVGGWGARDARTVYARLAKPAWAPPPQVFGPVWTGLYTGMAIAAWRLSRTSRATTPLALHAVQLGFNAAWPWAFFSGKDRRTALAISVALDAAVGAEIAAAARRDPLAAALLAPYLAWGLYATALTAAVSDPGTP
jgi:translocator protein